MTAHTWPVQLILTSLLVLAAAGQVSAQGYNRLRLESARQRPGEQVMELTVTQVDFAGGAVFDPRLDRYRVSVNGEALPLQNIGLANAPTDLVLIIHASQANDPALPPLLDGLQRLVRRLPTGSRVAVMAWGHITGKSTPLTSPPDAERVLQEIRSGTRSHLSALDAFRFASRTAEGSRHPRRGVILHLALGALPPDNHLTAITRLLDRAAMNYIVMHTLVHSDGGNPALNRAGALFGSHRVFGSLRISNSSTQLRGALDQITAELFGQMKVQAALPSRFLDASRHDIRVLDKDGEGAESNSLQTFLSSKGIGPAASPTLRGVVKAIGFSGGAVAFVILIFLWLRRRSSRPAEGKQEPNGTATPSSRLQGVLNQEPLFSILSLVSDPIALLPDDVQGADVLKIRTHLLGLVKEIKPTLAPRVGQRQADFIQFGAARLVDQLISARQIMLPHVVADSAWKSITPELFSDFEEGKSFFTRMDQAFIAGDTAAVDMLMLAANCGAQSIPGLRPDPEQCRLSDQIIERYYEPLVNLEPLLSPPQETEPRGWLPYLWPAAGLLLLALAYGLFHFNLLTYPSLMG